MRGQEQRRSVYDLEFGNDWPMLGALVKDELMMGGLEGYNPIELFMGL